MKVLIALVAAASLVLVGCSSGDDASVTPTSADEGTSTSGTSAGDSSGAGTVYEVTGDTTIDAAAGSTFTLSLEANATTGYQWSATVDGDAVRSTGGEYVAPSEGRVGQGGTQLLTFEAIAVGTATIDLTYAQAGSGDVGQEHTVTVDVT